MSIGTRSSAGFSPMPKGKTARQQRQARRTEDKKKLIEWHNIVVEKGRVGDGYYPVPMYRCFWCKDLFVRDKVCGDHFPKGRRYKATRYDPDNGVCSCMACNQSDAKPRAKAELPR